MQIHELNNFSGALGAGSFVAVDDGSDTGKLSTQQLLSATEAEINDLEATLNARIDNIIAGGTAPSAAEVTDARLGAADLGSVTYPSLGDAIRGQVTNLNSKALNIAESVNNKNKQLIAFYEVGAINNSGADVANVNYVRTDYIDISNIDVDYIEFINTTYQYATVFQYDNTKTFLTRQAYNISVPCVKLSLNPSCQFLRITHHKTDDVIIYVKDNTASEIKKTDIVSVSDISLMAEHCVHHDNFSRTESAGVIGKNSEGALTDNSYTDITSEDLTVNNGLTITANSNRTVPFTIQMITASVGENVLIETSVPNNGNIIYIVTDFTDSMNFKALELYKASSYMQLSLVNVVNGVPQTVIAKTINNTEGYVLRFYQIGFQVMLMVDDKVATLFTTDYKVKNIGLAGRKTQTAYFKFFNVFIMEQPPVFDTAPYLMHNESYMVNSVVSTNPGNYSLSQEQLFSCRYSEKFTLHSDDPLVENGKRCERSLVALFPNNLRTMKYQFRVFFPSSILPDTEVGGYGDIFFQLHDRQAGVSRGTVPFHLMLVGNKIKLTQHYSSQQASPTLINVVDNKTIGTVIYDEWMEFEVFIKERYEMQQNPLLIVKINGKVVYISREPNCPNDVNGSSAQYGEYKNQWGVITYSERYVDQMRVIY